MYDELKPIIKQIIKETPNGYMNRMKKEFPNLINYLNTLPFDTPGERFYNWYHVNVTNTCKTCNARCDFKQFSHGYYEYCSPSCRAKDKQSFRNAHDADGKSKGITKNKRAAHNAIHKRKQTVFEQSGTSLGQYSTMKRQESYYNKLPSQLKDSQFCLENTKCVTELAREFDLPTYTVKNAFKYHGIELHSTRRGYSVQELEVGEFLTSIGVSYTRNVRGLLEGRQEIDIYIPSKRLGIEYCGLFWHSDRNNYPPNKHIDKFLQAREAGITLITIFEDEWLTKRDIVESRLRSIFQTNVKVGARKCAVKRNVDHRIVKNCLDAWHIAGAKSSSKNVCLYVGNEIVAVLTYGKPRYNTNAEVEIIRYATKPGVTVVGGFSKLFAQVLEITNCRSVVSYSDNRWGNGGVYKHAGFIFDGITRPSYFYFKVNEGVRLHRSAFMKHKIVEKMKGSAELSEYNNMKKFGYNRIFDCGVTRWMWTKPVR